MSGSGEQTGPAGQGAPDVAAKAVLIRKPGSPVQGDGGETVGSIQGPTDPVADPGQGIREFSPTAMPDALAQPEKVSEGTAVPDGPSLPQRAHVEEVFQHILERARIQHSGETVTMRVSLEPDHLGPLRLELSWQDNALMAQFVVDNPEALATLEGGFHRLEETLRQQGIPVANLQAALTGEERRFSTRQGRQEGANEANRAKASALTGNGATVANEPLPGAGSLNLLA